MQATDIPQVAWILDLEDIEKDTGSLLVRVCKSQRESKSVRHAFKKGDVLYSKLRTYLNKVIVADQDGYSTTEIIPLDFKGFVIAEYARSVLMSNMFLAYTAQCGYGVKMPRLGTNDGRMALFPLPPLSEQQQIVTRINDLISITSKLENDKAELYYIVKQAKSKILDLAIRGKLVPQDPNDEAASVLLERIKAEHPESKKRSPKTSDNSHYENLPQGWVKCRLGNLGSWSPGATPSRSNKMYYTNGTVSWLKTGDLNDAYIDYIPEKITDLALKECSVRLNPQGSVLIAMYGATIGKIGILNISSTTNQACCACITHLGIYNKFLFYLLMSKKKALQMKAEGGAQPNISKEKIVNFPILLPPTQEQFRIVQAIDSLFNILESIVEDL
ncbi:restriction endonuclease subunit S [Parabacteroides sp. OttesenSCG-928-B22]|nr:restriction endonuclease subunit S [Parabacteroides sp. OttesenSCG-928-B22]